MQNSVYPVNSKAWTKLAPFICIILTLLEKVILSIEGFHITQWVYQNLRQMLSTSLSCDGGSYSRYINNVASLLTQVKQQNYILLVKSNTLLNKQTSSLFTLIKDTRLISLEWSYYNQRHSWKRTELLWFLSFVVVFEFKTFSYTYTHTKPVSQSILNIYCLLKCVITSLSLNTDF